MIHVCDAIMGSGKSSATINYINDHPDERFIYVTPYLDEAARIREGCPAADFVEPASTKEHAYSKLKHIAALLREGRNIASTHTAFKMFTNEMLNCIRELGYTLFVDEAVATFAEAKFKPGDVGLLEMMGLFNASKPDYERMAKYDGTLLGDIVWMVKSNNLVRFGEGNEKVKYFYWSLHSDLLKAFKNVFILTYLFKASDLSYYLDMNKIEHNDIGISYDGERYTFCPHKDYVPAYAANLGSMIHILDNDKMNAIGEKRTALSAEWMKKHRGERDRLRKNLVNYFHNMCDGKSCQIMWTCFKSDIDALKGNGYITRHVPYNARATNKYKGCKYLAYTCNVFANPIKHRFFEANGMKYDDDAYALSTMVQWIWRSSIRDGNEVYIYIPSKRMRTLLRNWIDSFTRQETDKL